MRQPYAIQWPNEPSILSIISHGIYILLKSGNNVANELFFIPLLYYQFDCDFISLHFIGFIWKYVSMCE